jgi:hypothetical protein
MTCEWLPITDAPTDRSLFLFGTAFTYDGYYQPNAMVIGSYCKHTQSWHVTALGAPRIERIDPTLYCELPNKPVNGDNQ